MRRLRSCGATSTSSATRATESVLVHMACHGMYRTCGRRLGWHAWLAWSRQEGSASAHGLGWPAWLAWPRQGDRRGARMGEAAPSRPSGTRSPTGRLWEPRPPTRGRDRRRLTMYSHVSLSSLRSRQPLLSRVVLCRTLERWLCCAARFAFRIEHRRRRPGPPFAIKGLALQTLHGAALNAGLLLALEGLLGLVLPLLVLVTCVSVTPPPSRRRPPCASR